jgi:hypothetical protein
MSGKNVKCAAAASIARSQNAAQMLMLLLPKNRGREMMCNRSEGIFPLQSGTMRGRQLHFAK